jgi:hypothetical protein
MNRLEWLQNTVALAVAGRVKEVDCVQYAHTIGVCGLIAPLKAEFDRLAPVFKSWVGFSGDLVFPVEGSFVDYSCNDKWEGRYSKARKSLLKHILANHQQWLQYPDEPFQCFITQHTWPPGAVPVYERNEFLGVRIDTEMVREYEFAPRQVSCQQARTWPLTF